MDRELIEDLAKAGAAIAPLLISLITGINKLVESNGGKVPEEVLKDLQQARHLMNAELFPLLDAAADK